MPVTSGILSRARDVINYSRRLIVASGRCRVRLMASHQFVLSVEQREHQLNSFEQWTRVM